MIIHLLVLFIASSVWGALLWFGIAPDFSTWSVPRLVGLHVLPPLFIWLSWWLLRRQAQKKKTAEKQLREANEQAERQTALDEARKKHEEELRQRRFACDCRMVAVTRIGTTSGLLLEDAVSPQIDIRASSLEDMAGEAGEQMLDRLTPAITDALSAIYEACRASLAFPIYIVPPAELSGQDVLARLRAIHTEFARAHETVFKLRDSRTPILYLPSSDCASNSVISLFDTTPDLPGAIILAFDSPFSRSSSEETPSDDEPDPERTAREQRVGKPSEAVVGLLMTNAELPTMLAAIADVVPVDAEHDSMIPFWDKSVLPAGNLAILARATLQLRKELSDLPVLGRVHRAVQRQPANSSSGVLEMTRLLQDTLERAQINAGLIVPPFVPDEATQGQSTEQPKNAAVEKNRCGRIVHNAGGVTQSGKRVAALGGALYYYGVDISPADEDVATNMVTSVGELGRASSVAQLALGIAYAAQQIAPVLCAEFSDGDSVTVSFVMPGDDE